MHLFSILFSEPVKKHKHIVHFDMYAVNGWTYNQRDYFAISTQFKTNRYSGSHINFVMTYTRTQTSYRICILCMYMIVMHLRSNIPRMLSNVCDAAATCFDALDAVHSLSSTTIPIRNLACVDTTVCKRYRYDQDE